jgi:hypothetical protein
MFLTKLKVAAAVFLLIMTGAVLLVSQATAQKPVVSSERKGGHAQASKTPTHDDEIDLTMLERAWADAIPRRDLAVISRILADDFEGIEPLGDTISKTAYLADLRRGVLSAEPDARATFTPGGRAAGFAWPRTGRA